MPAERTRFSRARAIGAGALAGTVAGGVPVLLVFLTMAAMEADAAPGVFLLQVVAAAWGILITGAIVAVPIATVMVWTMTIASRWLPAFDTRAAWTVGGVTCACPSALLWWMGLSPHDMGFGWAMMAVHGLAGAVGGWVAWNHRLVPPPSAAMASPR